MDESVNEHRRASMGVTARSPCGQVGWVTHCWTGVTPEESWGWDQELLCAWRQSGTSLLLDPAPASING